MRKGWVGEGERKLTVCATFLAFEVYVLSDEAFAPIYVIGGAKTSELEKLAYKMGLIEVSAINGKVCPID